MFSVTLIQVGQGSQPGRYSSDGGDANDKRSVARVWRPTLCGGTSSVVCRMALAVGQSGGMRLMFVATGWQVIQGGNLIRTY